METRTIVVDVDDTISTHTDRDYANAVPHRGVIDKLNRMRRDGWRVVYHTARGQLSCAGDLELIERERRPVLEDWMRRNGAEYDELLFGKPLGVYYVDDKALRPDEFMRLRIDRLQGGSGAIVERIGDRVTKKAANASEQAAWYLQARRMGFHVPKLHSHYGDSLTMEFVEGRKLSDALDPSQAGELAAILGRLSRTDVGEGPTWDTMVRRVEGHAAFNDFPHRQEIMELLDRPVVHEAMNASRSFCHGDLTLENVIGCPVRGPVMIDPNRPRGLFSSWVLDLGKLYQSIIYGYEARYLGGARHDDPLRAFGPIEAAVKDRRHLTLGNLAVLVHFIRMIRYKTGNQRAMVLEDIRRIWNHLLPW